MNFVIFPLLTQLHPAVIHFPMALLYIEFFFLCLYLAKKKDEYDNFSHWLLLLCSLSFVPVLLTGLHDSGADLGPGVQFINGFFDRVENFLRFESTISIHVICSLIVVFITLARLFWRMKSGKEIYGGMQCALFLALTICGLVMTFVTGYLGGSISHN